VNILSLVRFFGNGALERSLAGLLRKHATQGDYQALTAALTLAVAGCVKGDPDATAQALADALFLIH
jgi:hypothetical protein